MNYFHLKVVHMSQPQPPIVKPVPKMASASSSANQLEPFPFLPDPPQPKRIRQTGSPNLKPSKFVPGLFSLSFDTKVLEFNSISKDSLLFFQAYQNYYPNGVLPYR